MNDIEQDSIRCDRNTRLNCHREEFARDFLRYMTVTKYAEMDPQVLYNCAHMVTDSLQKYQILFMMEYTRFKHYLGLNFVTDGHTPQTNQ